MRWDLRGGDAQDADLGERHVLVGLGIGDDAVIEVDGHGRGRVHRCAAEVLAHPRDAAHQLGDGAAQRVLVLLESAGKHGGVAYHLGGGLESVLVVPGPVVVAEAAGDGEHLEAGVDGRLVVGDAHLGLHHLERVGSLVSRGRAEGDIVGLAECGVLRR